MAGIDGTDNPQIIEHLSKSLNLTPYDVKWIPCSSRFVMLGENARATGALHVYELSKGEMKLVKQVSGRGPTRLRVPCTLYPATPACLLRGSALFSLALNAPTPSVHPPTTSLLFPLRHLLSRRTGGEAKAVQVRHLWGVFHRGPVPRDG